MKRPPTLFESSCCEAFRVLILEHGFDEPLIRPIGRETFIDYVKGDRRVSISAEVGCRPLVEIYQPVAETGDRPLPWASRDGVERSRRFPDLKLAEEFVRGDADSLKAYLRAQARELVSVEREFLARDSRR